MNSPYNAVQDMAGEGGARKKKEMTTFTNAKDGTGQIFPSYTEILSNGPRANASIRLAL